jgi:Protein of unknown function (DUF2827)
VKRLKLGVTVVGGQRDAHSALWSSGIAQNVVYLTMLMQRLPEVELAALVVCPPGSLISHPLGDVYGLPVIGSEDAAASLDVIIELGARVEVEIADRFRARGGKLVSYMAGNAMIMNFEELANDIRHGDYVSVPFDAVWITPQHWRTNHSYAAVTRTPNVVCAPHIWHPICLNQSAFQLKLNPFYRPPVTKTWRIGVFDPNINVVKTFHFPLLVCEQAYRLQPALIDRVLLFSASQLMGNSHFEEFIAVTDLGRDKRVFAETRYALAQVMGVFIDVVVTHQWENSLNYLYWDVLYLGWPLIHNSPEFRDVGYYYPSFDPLTGGKVLAQALADHPSQSPAGRQAVHETLWRFNIDNPEVQRRHAEMLEDLMSR